MNARQSIDSDPAGGERSSATAGHVLVVGLGDTGLSCIRHLSESHRRVVAVDSRERPPRRTAVESEFPGVELHCGRFDTPLFESAEEIVVSPDCRRTSRRCRPRQFAASPSSATSSSSPAQPMRR